MRLALVQWPQKPFLTENEMIEEMLGWAKIAAGSGANVLLFPEHLSWSISSACGFETANGALRHLALFSQKIVEKGQDFSQKTGISILLGSLPVLKNGLKNVAFFIEPDRREPLFYEKIHLTPWEKMAGFEAGSAVKIFETRWGKIAPAICYDVEFPETVRLAALAGAEILLVPFQTDNEAGFWRVRTCAAARAIENELFVAVAGNVGCPLGNPVMDSNFARSAILTPCDSGWPTGGILREATTNLPEIIFADLDLDFLRAFRNGKNATVRTIADRRTDLFELRKK